MGNKKFSRRNFFQTLTEKEQESITENAPDREGNDPLFEKYARRSLGPRHYSRENITYKLETIDAENSATRQGNITSGVAPYTGTWTEWESAPLLRRTNFGWKKSFVDALLPLGPSAAVNAVLQINTTPPTPPVNWYQNFFTDEKGLAYGADWTAEFFPTSSPGQSSNHYRMDALRMWSFGLTLNGDASIREKMVWFWYHFLPIDFESIYQSSNANINTNSSRIFYRYLKLFRDSALGNFKTLISNVAKSPSMMYYLNNQANTATAPDENFARELMELFTLGKDPASQYTQADVVAAAKVLTGWRVQNLNTANEATNFIASAHSNGAKQFSSFFNNKVIPDALGAGAPEITSLINMIFGKDVVVSQYICRRLYRYFVYYDIDANVETNVIAPLAQTFVASNWEILPVLKQLFNSQHFFDMANRGVYIKSPFDLVAGTLNMFKINTTGNSIENQYRLWGYYNDNICNAMGQRMGTIPNVSGWDAYFQTPAYHEYWINANSVQKRFDFIQRLFNGYTQNGTAIKADVIAFAQQFGAATAADPNLLVAACIRYLLPVDLSQAQKDTLKTASLLGNQVQDHYWPDAWNDYLANLTNTTKKGIVENRLKTLLSGLCQLAEFQLM